MSACSARDRGASPSARCRRVRQRADHRVVGDLWTSAVSNVTGNVVTTAVEVHARDVERQKEIDRRLVPNIPSGYQFAYLFGLVAGVLGWPVASAWFARLWPPEQREEYRNGVGYRTAQGVRLLAYFLCSYPWPARQR